MIFLLLAGAAAAGLAIWIVDNPHVLPGSGMFIAALLGIFFVSWTLALLQYLRGRDKERGTISMTSTTQADPDGTVYGLVPGRKYEVLKSFKDFYGNSFEQGQVLRFKQRHFLPYHGGHTIVFEERSLYLQEDQNKDILDRFAEYIAQLEG